MTKEKTPRKSGLKKTKPSSATGGRTAKRKTTSVADAARLEQELKAARAELGQKSEEMRLLRQELCFSQSRLQALIDHAPAAIYVKDRGGRYIMINRVAADFLKKFKVNSRDAIGKTDHELFPREIADAFVEDDVNLIETGTAVEEEDCVPEPDGMHTYLEHKFPLRDDSGAIYAVVGIATDITHRKEAERAQRESEERYRSIVEMAPDAVAVHAGGKYVYINPAGVKLFGAQDAAEIIGRPVLDFVHPECRAGVVQRIQKIYEERRSNPLHEAKALRVDGTAFDVEVTSAPVTRDGMPASQMILRDITARKKTEDRLQKATEEANRQRMHLEAILDTIPSGIIVYDRASAKITLQNRQVSALFGLPLDAVDQEQRIRELKMSKLDGSLFPPGELPGMQAIQTGEPVRNVEMQVTRTDGNTITILANAAPLRDATGGVTGSIVAFNDITQRKRIMDDLQAAHTTLQRRTAELDDLNKQLETFAYTIAHDLKAPLRSVEGFTRAVLEDHAGVLDETARDYLQRANSASERMTQLIDAMFTMARLTQGELQENVVNLGPVARLIAQDLRNGDPGRRVEFVIQENVKVRGDRSMLELLLRNLFDNAWKFTGKHPTARIEFGSRETGGKTVCFVKDDGAGFNGAYADKLFKPFQRLHGIDEFPGLGIGLATAHRIVVRHGGRMWAEGSPEHGTTFYFTLE